MTALDLTEQELFVLTWLSVGDSSNYGECRGNELDRLIGAGLARVTTPPPLTDHSRVSLTEAGWQMLRGMEE